MGARAVPAILAAGLWLGSGLAAVGPAAAADLASVPEASYRSLHQAPVRAGMTVIADDQPGVALRPYWRQPWRDRHYFPATGRRPKVGRDENLSARHAPLRRAASYERHWWVSSVIVPEFPPRAPGQGMEPRLK
ncbi:MAG TPA: hypothetical protein VG986_19865 [Pseudolabrys sp.]|nr:hypothetical protein [Pseudolabrys sp.]